MNHNREDITISRTNSGDYWLVAHRKGNYQLFWSLSPHSFSAENELPTFSDGTMVLNPASGSHCYFHLFDNDYYIITSVRGPIMDGFSNLRDLGGYNTADGKNFVSYGLIFRGGMPGSMSPEEIPIINELGIKQILDFRHDVEAADVPQSKELFGAYKRISVLQEDISVSVLKYAEEILSKPEIGLKLSMEFLNTYHTMFINNEAFRMLFRFLIEGKTPLLYHCVNGKDRTGVATALILLALGVPEDTIVYDYMLTNEFCKKKIEMGIRKFQKKYPIDERVTEILITFFSVREQAIQNTLSTIKSKYKDLNIFFRDELGVSDKELKLLKLKYLMPHENTSI